MKMVQNWSHIYTYIILELKQKKTAFLRIQFRKKPCPRKGKNNKQSLRVTTGFLDSYSAIKVQILWLFHWYFYLGLTQSQIGVVAGSLDVSCLFCSFLVGSLTNPANVKFVSITGTLLCSLTIASFGLLNFMPGSGLYFFLCVITRAINGAGVAMTYAMLNPIPVKCFPEKAGLMAGIIQTCFGLGMFSGPIVGSVLIPVGGYSAPFLFAGVTEALFSLIAYFVFPPDENSTEKDKNKQSGDFLKFLGTSSAMSVIVPSVVVFFMSGFRDAAYSLHFHEAIGIDLHSMGFVFVPSAIAEATAGKCQFNTIKSW